jgi:hypothetical protein
MSINSRNALTLLGISASAAIAGAPAMAVPAVTVYSYDCTLRLPLNETSEYEYRITATVDYDNEKLVMTNVNEPKISLYRVDNGTRTFTYLKEQPLVVATRAERFAVLDYKQAAYSLNARLSISQGPEAATAKVYHIHTERFGVSSTPTTACSVSSR